MRTLVGGGRGLLVGLLAMFVRRHGVLLRFLVLAEIVMMSGLVVMMGGGVVMGGGLMMMLARRMLRLCHGIVPPNRSWKNMPAASIWSGFCSRQPASGAANRQMLRLDGCSAWARQRKTLDLLGFPPDSLGFALDFPWICLDFLRRIAPFQWVTATPKARNFLWPLPVGMTDSSLA